MMVLACIVIVLGHEFQTTSCTYLHIEQYNPASYLLQHISSASSWHLSRLIEFDPAICNW